MSGFDVVELFDSSGNVAGYAAGKVSELSKMVTTGWSPNSLPGSPLPILKEAMSVSVRETRKQAEERGVVVNGNVFATDIASQIKYTGILLYAAMHRDYVGTWKTLNNSFVTLDAGGVSFMAASVMTHIRLCDAWEQESLARIDAADTVAALKNLDLSPNLPTGQLANNVVSEIQSTGGVFGTEGNLGNSSGVISAVTGTFTELRAERFRALDAMFRDIPVSVPGPYSSRAYVLSTRWMCRRGDAAPTWFYVRGIHDYKQDMTPMRFKVIDMERNQILGVIAPITGNGLPTTLSTPLENTKVVPGSDDTYTIEVFGLTNGRSYTTHCMGISFA